MRKAFLWLGLAIGFGLCIGTIVNVIAQPITNLQPSGNECWNAGQGPGGPSQFLCINQVRNTAGLLVNNGPVGPGNVQGTTAVNTLALNAQPAQGTTIITPANPVADGQFFQVCNVTGSNFATNTVVLTPSSGQSMQVGAVSNSLVNISLTTLNSKVCVEVVFQLASLTWFQIR